ncbi:MAG: ACT domain-containing protein [Anaerolineae bacterium]|nr:ACT domain-containing protein [Anaerolineae bacterium]
MDRLAGAPSFRATLILHKGRLAICRLAPHDPLPAQDLGAPFWSVTRTSDELSVVLPEDAVGAGWRAEPGWRCLQVAGPLDLALTGVLHALSAPLAAAGIPLFALSTFDTDYLLVREDDLARAIEALARAGHQTTGGGT